LARRSAEVQDRIEYVSFRLNAEKYEVIDGTALKDSWVYRTKSVFSSVNRTLQDLSLGVLELLFDLLEVVVYAGITIAVIALAIRFGWHFLKSLWVQKKPGEYEHHEHHEHHEHQG